MSCFIEELENYAYLERKKICQTLKTHSSTMYTNNKAIMKNNALV